MAPLKKCTHHLGLIKPFPPTRRSYCSGAPTTTDRSEVAARDRHGTSPIQETCPTFQADDMARTRQRVCGFTLNRSFCPPISSTTSVRADSPILESHKLRGHKTTPQQRCYLVTQQAEKTTRSYQQIILFIHQEYFSPQSSIGHAMRINYQSVRKYKDRL